MQLIFVLPRLHYEQIMQVLRKTFAIYACFHLSAPLFVIKSKQQYHNSHCQELPATQSSDEEVAATNQGGFQFDCHLTACLQDSNLVASQRIPVKKRCRLWFGIRWVFTRPRTCCIGIICIIFGECFSLQRAAITGEYPPARLVRLPLMTLTGTMKIRKRSADCRSFGGFHKLGG